MRWGRIGAVVAAWLYAACVVIQVFLAGLATFDTASRWSDHVNFGQWIGVLTILLIICAIAGRLPRTLAVLSALVFLLYGMQYPFANSEAGAVAALHAVNALAMFTLSLHIGARARPLISAT